MTTMTLTEKESEYLRAKSINWGCGSGYAVEVILPTEERLYVKFGSIQYKWAENVGLSMRGVRFVGACAENTLGHRVSSRSYPIMINGVETKNMGKKLVSEDAFLDFFYNGNYTN